MRMRLIGAGLWATLSVFTTSCGITGIKQCRFEHRSVTASGELVLPDASTANARVALIEERESSSRPTTARLVVGSQSYSLYPHMTKAELRDTQTPSRLFGSYLPGVGQETWAPNLVGMFYPYDWPLTLDQAWALVESGQLVMEITTDLPDQSLVRIPLRTTEHADWYREQGDACG